MIDLVSAVSSRLHVLFKGIFNHEFGVDSTSKVQIFGWGSPGVSFLILGFSQRSSILQPKIILYHMFETEGMMEILL